MAYTRAQSKLVVENGVNALLNDADRTMVLATFLALDALDLIITDAGELAALIASRYGKEFRLRDTAAIASEGTVTIATNATGDGVVGFSIDGVEFTNTPAAADTPTVIAAALAVLVNKSLTHTAVAALGVLTVTDRTPGVAGDSVTFVDLTDDTTTTATLVQPTGGADLVADTHITLGSESVKFGGTSAGVA